MIRWNINKRRINPARGHFKDDGELIITKEAFIVPVEPDVIEYDTKVNTDVMFELEERCIGISPGLIYQTRYMVLWKLEYN